VIEGGQMDEVQKNQYYSLYWCGAWRRSSTHQAIATVPKTLYDTRHQAGHPLSPSSLEA